MTEQQYFDLLRMLDQLGDQMTRVVDIVAELRDKVEDLEATVTDSQ